MNCQNRVINGGFRINAGWYNDVGVATIHMYLRTYYEGVAKHVVRRDTITMVKQRKLKRSYDVSFKLRAVESVCRAIESVCRPVETRTNYVYRSNYVNVFINAGPV